MTERKVVLYIATSIDCYIAGPNDDLDWLFHDQDYGYSQFLQQIDTIFMGRRSWDILKSFGPWPYSNIFSYIFSHSNHIVNDDNVEVVTEDPIIFSKRLLKSQGKDIWLFGGGQLVTTFLKADLIDEIILSIHPILLGDGIPLFLSNFPTKKFKLLSSKDYSSGLVQLHFVRSQ